MRSLIPLLLSASCMADTAPPIPVEAWGGKPPAFSQAAQRIERITLHHLGERWSASADPEAYLRWLQNWSRLTKRWADIPYHYVIAPDGRVFAARPEALPGDTNTGYDTRGHALVMLLGNFEEQDPSPEQLEAAVQLMAELARRHRVPVERIASHRDVSEGTVCPGARLWPRLPELRERVRGVLARPTP